jgi:hypothetical protein
MYQLLPILLLLSKVWIKWDGINPPGQVGSGEGSNQDSSRRRKQSWQVKASQH